MMMSMFSSFEAFSAEFFGQKASLSNPVASTEMKQQKKGLIGSIISDRKSVAALPSNSSTGGLKKAGEAAPSSSRQQQQQKMPRFALELDGVHCFETIVPY